MAEINWTAEADGVSRRSLALSLCPLVEGLMLRESIEIKFEGPLYWLAESECVSVFQHEIADCPGIYLWSVPYQQAEMVYYVGETSRSFRERLKKHLVSYLAGLYRLYEPEHFARGNKCLIWDGMWKSGEELRMAEFIRRHNELAPKIHQLIRLLRFHLAPLTVDTRRRQRIEAAIANVLSKQSGIPGQFQDGDIRYWPRNPDEQEIAVCIKCNSRILGLPEELLV